MASYLHGFLRGTRSALYENGRESITISIPDVNAFDLGALIALYERALSIDEQTFAADHPKLAEIRSSIEALRAGV